MSLLTSWPWMSLPPSTFNEFIDFIASKYPPSSTLNHDILSLSLEFSHTHQY